MQIYLFIYSRFLQVSIIRISIQQSITNDDCRSEKQKVIKINLQHYQTCQYYSINTYMFNIYSINVYVESEK